MSVWDHVRHHDEEGPEDDRPLWEKHDQHVARIQHHCIWCEHAILPGQAYRKYVCVEADGKFHMHKTHLDAAYCEERRQALEPHRAQPVPDEDLPF